VRWVQKATQLPVCGISSRSHSARKPVKFMSSLILPTVTWTLTSCKTRISTSMASLPTYATVRILFLRCLGPVRGPRRDNQPLNHLQRCTQLMHPLQQHHSPSAQRPHPLPSLRGAQSRVVPHSARLLAAQPHTDPLLSHLRLNNPLQNRPRARQQPTARLNARQKSQLGDIGGSRHFGLLLTLPFLSSSLSAQVSLGD